MYFILAASEIMHKETKGLLCVHLYSMHEQDFGTTSPC